MSKHSSKIRPKNDRFMVRSRLRLPLFELDQSVFAKTPEEKRLIKVLKRAN